MKLYPGHEKISKKETRIRAGEIMKKIGMDDYERVLDSYPFELSGGMNQRVGICAAMIMHPNLLLADEPTSALDVTVQKQVVEELLMMRKEYQTAMILVTHNIGVVRAMADRILVLQNGTVRDYGETKNASGSFAGSVYAEVDEFGASFEERTYLSFLERNDFG